MLQEIKIPVVGASGCEAAKKSDLPRSSAHRRRSFRTQLENPDVRNESPWGDMWRHDFWGQDITDAESHKSFRPLTTLTYRFVCLDPR